MSTVSQGRRWERETCWWSWNRTQLKCDLSTGISLNLSTSSQEDPHWQTDWILFLPVALYVFIVATVKLMDWMVTHS